MKPIEFEHQTQILQKPQSMTDAECGPLPIFNDGKHCISCWRLSLWEQIKLIWTGEIWLSIHSGNTQPPVLLTVDEPFEKK